MNIKEARRYLEPWFKMREHSVLDLFYDYGKKNGAICRGHGDYRSVFIPGERKDRVLIVAHADTVWNDSPKLDVGYEDGFFFSKARKRGVNEKGIPYVGGFGIGADDRAGTAICWLLRGLGHSILITNGEETGCLGANFMMADDENAAIIQDHAFAVQFDRANRNDLVFYNVGSASGVFEEYCQKQTGYKEAVGSFTDICILCEQICGVNVSVGYKSEHTCNETLNVRHWLRTLGVANLWLESKGIPSFRQDQ